MPRENSRTELCFHCGNRVPLELVAVHHGKELFEHMEGHRYSECFDYRLYQCPTCYGITIYGDFSEYSNEDPSRQRIHPMGSRLLPEPHKIASKTCVPEKILSLYEQTWPLRHISPIAFATQVRRALEYICIDQGAVGKTLDAKLKDLAVKQTFPGHFAEMTDLMRRIGNLGAHASDREVEFWDAELLDDFFRSVVEYVYITPSRIVRMRQRLESDA